MAGPTSYVGLRPGPGARGNRRSWCASRSSPEGLDGVAGEERLAIGIVVLGLAGILLLWWQLHREARIADQIRDSEERFRSITQAALHPIVVTDDEGRITYWNDAAERTFGYRREEVLERSLLESLVPAADFTRTIAERLPFRVPGGPEAGAR